MRRGSGAPRTGRTTIQRSRGLLPLSRSSAESTAASRKTGYIGRFAPSPTGPLHLGSLFTAVASYLHARSVGGSWLVRIEDIDPPREAPGAADWILRTLEAYALHWDGAVSFQSHRYDRYRAVATQLLRDGLVFSCRCSRKQLRERGGVHAGVCSTRQYTPGSDTSLRVAVAGQVTTSRVTFTDSLQGRVCVDLADRAGDYVILRRDGLPAYHLAVVVDDADQGITDVVRGIDLLDSTATHIHLQNVLAVPSPRYTHVPVVVNSEGQKLSKQTRARPVSTANNDLSATAISVLSLLGTQVPPEAIGASPEELWSWAHRHWDPMRLHGQRMLELR